MEPVEFFNVALKLAQGESAGEKRTAVSRAYYAAFHVCAQVIETVGGRVDQGPGGHGCVFKTLGGCGNQEIAKLGHKLQDLHGRRRKADYFLRDAKIEKNSNVNDVMKIAKDIIDNIEEICLHGPNQMSVRNAIIVYQRDNNMLW